MHAIHTQAGLELPRKVGCRGALDTCTASIPHSNILNNVLNNALGWPGIEYQVPGTRYEVRGAGYEVRGTGYEVRGTRYVV